MFSNYLKLALRNLYRNRTFATLSTLGLGLSIGCCLLIFLLVRHHLSVDRFHAKADRTVLIVTESKGEVNSREGNVPYPMGAALRQEYAFLEKTAMVSGRENSLVTILKDGAAPVKFKEVGERAFAEPELFEIFDFPLASGSLEGFKQPKTALLTEKMALRYFGTTDAVGKSFRVNNNTDYQVVGVLRDIPENTDLRYRIYCSWSTLTSDDGAKRMLSNWGGIHGGTQCFASLREGHGLAELETAFTSFREKYFHPEVRELYYHAAPLADVHFDADLGPGTSKSQVWALSLIGLFLLITASLNFVNMATAQALNRAREVGVRKAVGSTRSQLFWQFMSEAGLIVAFSTLAGFLAAYLALPALNSLLDTHLRFPLSEGLAFYAFLGVTMVLVTLMSGAYPGLALSRFRAAESLRGSFDQQKAGGFSLRRILVGTQFGISQMLIIGAVTVTTQMEYTRKADLGFRKEGMVVLPIEGEFDVLKQHRLAGEFRAVPGVQMVSLSSQPPASDANWNTRMRLEGQAEQGEFEVNLKFVDSGYQEAFGLKLLAGRNLTTSDTALELLVNRELVRKYGLSSPEEILGKKIYVGKEGYPVAGVVENFHNRSFRDPIIPQVMICDAGNYNVFNLKIDLAQARQTMAAVEKIWTAAFPEYYFEYDFLDDRIAKFYRQDSTVMQLMRLFAGIAVFIGCLGLYGLASFMVTRKRKEIGIRKTLGASVAGVLWLFGKEYVRLLVFAFVVAAPFAWWAMNRWLDAYAFRISIGAGILTVSLLLTFAVAVFTVGFQSVRAALANPVQSLRTE